MGTSTRWLLGLVRRLLDGDIVESTPTANAAPIKPGPARRLLNELKDELGEHVVVDGRRNRRFRYQRPGTGPSSSHELTALALAREFFVFLKDSELDYRIRQLASSAMGRAGSTGLGAHDVSRMFVVRTRVSTPHGIDPDAVDQITDLLMRGRLIAADYRHFDGRLDRIEVHGYSLVLSDDGLYLFGRCLLADNEKYIDQVREFNVARMKHVRAADDAEPRPYPTSREYQPTKQFEHCWGIFLPSEGEEAERAILHFASWWATFLEHHRWHVHQSAPERVDSDWVRVSFEVYLTQDFVQFVRGHGPSVRAVAPERLVQWIETGEDPSHRGRRA